MPVRLKRKRSIKRKQPRTRTPKYTPFQDVGSKIGGLFGPTGAAMGGGLGTLIGKIFGSGDYYAPMSVQSNSLVNTTEVPQFSATSPLSAGGGMMVCHREYIRDIVSNGTGSTFSLESFNINPAQSNLFPWLSTIAASYEEYIVHGMVFEFKTTSADSLPTTNTALGTVIMATQYNVNSNLFTNKIEMENYQFAQSCKPSISQMHAVECSKSNRNVNQYFIRDKPLSSTQDPSLYDFARFNIATTGFQAASNIGELWCSYMIELRLPKIPKTLGGPIPCYAAYTTGITTSQPLGLPANTTVFTNTFGSPFSVLPSGIIFGDSLDKDEYYLLTLQWEVASTAVTSYAVSYSTGLSAFNLWSNKTLSTNSSPPNGTTSTKLFQQIAFYSDGTTKAATTNITLSAGIVGIGNVTILLTKLDSSIGG